MPSGYTCDIAKDISFNEFAMDCARAFGACITMRDDPTGGDKIPEKFEPSTYNKDRVKHYEFELIKYETMDPQVAERKADEGFIKECRTRAGYIREKENLAEKYHNMLNQVIEWEPPTEDHVGLKNFMIQQIEDSIKHDCNIEYNDHIPPLLTGVEWLEGRIEMTIDDIEYHTRGDVEEIERVDIRNEWVEDLRNSLLCDDIDDLPDEAKIELIFPLDDLSEWK